MAIGVQLNTAGTRINVRQFGGFNNIVAARPTDACCCQQSGDGPWVQFRICSINILSGVWMHISDAGTVGPIVKYGDLCMYVDPATATFLEPTNIITPQQVTSFADCTACWGGTKLILWFTGLSPCDCEPAVGAPFHHGDQPNGIVVLPFVISGGAGYGTTFRYCPWTGANPDGPFPYELSVGGWSVGNTPSVYMGKTTVGWITNPNGAAFSGTATSAITPGTLGGPVTIQNSLPACRANVTQVQSCTGGQVQVWRV